MMSLRRAAVTSTDRQHSIFRYGLAIAIALVAIGCRAILATYLNSAPFITFFPAVVLVAYVAGQRPALLTAMLCGIAGWYLFIPPLRSFRIESPAEAVTLSVYLVTSIAIALLIGSWRAAIQRERRSSAALRASEEQFRLLADSSPALIWVTDENAQVTFANRRYEEVFGKAADAIEGEGWRSIVHPDDVEVFNAHFLTALTGRERFVGEVRVLNESGEIMWLHCEGVPRFTTDGSFVGYVGANLDISQVKWAEERLRELNESLETRIADALAQRKLLADLVEDTDAFVQVADQDFRWLAINKAAADEFERIYGVRPEVGDSMLELLRGHPEELEAVRAVWARALSGEHFTETGEFGRSERTRRHYEMRYSTLSDEAGAAIGAYQFVYDVTDRVQEQQRLREAEEALRQSQKMEAMGQLTGGVAHDFNNLLTPIVGSLDMLQRKGIGTEREQRLIAGAAKSAERAKILVQRLLAFARRQPLQPVSVDVAKLVKGMGELISSTTGPQIEVFMQAGDGLPAAKADPNQLEMALLNLSVNARDAMPHGGTLRISASAEVVDDSHAPALKPGSYVKLSVADTGSGMDEATLARAVEPFFSTKGVGKGTGLGLSMVHGLASQLGGVLTIQSRLGLGTNVELWLPQSAGAPTLSRSGVQMHEGASTSGTALLVDDEELVRLSTADMLIELGYTVVEATSGEEALRLVEEGKQFDLLVTDHLMPGMTGTDLAHAVRALNPDVAILLVSGYAEFEGIEADVPRLTKPFRKDELASCLDSLCVRGANRAEVASGVTNATEHCSG